MKSQKSKRDEPKFKTDAEISNTKFRERELEKWVPEGDLNDALTLEDDNSGNWDQFKVNKEKFGIDSTFDEHLYTTRIDTTAGDYQERLKRATKLAHEIEHDINSDPHVLEERGKIDDSGLDEEAKYSGVIKDEEELQEKLKKDTRGDELMAALKSVKISDQKYIPPKPKALNESHKDPAIVSTEKPQSIPSKPVTNGHNGRNGHELFRLNAQSEINSLKEFSATFKVPHKLPNDLLPILAKDKSKQDEIVKKISPTPQKKMDPTKPAFKLNPKAAAFTPIQPTPPPKINNRSSNPSPRMNNNQRPYSSSMSGSSKRHYQISPADFFGGQNKIPTKESQIEKSKKFKKTFNLFVTVKSKTPKDGPVNIEKAFITPPTWEQTVDEPYYNLYPTPDLSRFAMMMPLPFMGGIPPLQHPGSGSNPASSVTSPQSANLIPHSGGFQSPTTPGSQMAAYQQQQYQAMMYQQQFGMIPPNQPPMPGMYMPGGQEFMMPGYMASPPSFNGGSPTGPRLMTNNNSYQNSGYQNYSGGRRYSKRS